MNTERTVPMPKIDGFKIRKLRNAKGVSAREVSASVGLSEAMIHKIEDGTKNTNAIHFKVIADYYGVKVDELYV